MQGFDIRDFTGHIYKNCRLEQFRHNWIAGYFPDEERGKSGLVRFSFTFSGGKNAPDPDFGFHEEPVTLLNLTASECGDVLNVTVETTAGTFTFPCGGVIANLERYAGMSYRNVYAALKKPEISEDWFEEETETRLADDLTILHRHYCHKRFNAKGQLCAAHSFGKYRLLKNGAEVHAWVNGDDQVTLQNPLIQHSDGRRYVAFQVDLYGLCFVEPDSGEVYNYVPEGLPHDYRGTLGESFIITDIYYDQASDLCAFGGCYWACPYEVFVGNLQNPLAYDPHFVRVGDILDNMLPEEYCGDDIDFVRWTDDALTVQLDGQEYTIPKSELQKSGDLK